LSLLIHPPFFADGAASFSAAITLQKQRGRLPMR
jgi:hypothetical protein